METFNLLSDLKNNVVCFTNLRQSSLSTIPQTAIVLKKQHLNKYSHFFSLLSLLTCATGASQKCLSLNN